MISRSNVRPGPAMITLYQVAEEITRRLSRHVPPEQRRQSARPRRTQQFQEDPHWRDYLLFYEYFHGDNGAGLGASHQTGWTGIVARLMHMFAAVTEVERFQTSRLLGRRLC